MTIRERERVEIRRRQQGYCVEGPGFYVWDEDPREVSRAARDLARGLSCDWPAKGVPIAESPEPPTNRGAEESRGARECSLRGRKPGGCEPG